jgi:hypothetical protein
MGSRFVRSPLVNIDFAALVDGNLVRITLLGIPPSADGRFGVFSSEKDGNMGIAELNRLLLPLLCPRLLAKTQISTEHRYR